MNVHAADAPTPSDHPAWLAFEGAQARVVVDLDAIVRNATTLKARVGDAQLMAVVKGDAYGHGLVPTARAALRGGATWLGVAQLHEATALRDAGIDAREQPAQHAGVDAGVA